MLLSYPVGGPMRDGRSGKDPILFHRARLPPLRCASGRALHVVVEAGDDVSGRRALQVCRLLLPDAVLQLCLVARQQPTISSPSAPFSRWCFGRWTAVAPYQFPLERPSLFHQVSHACLRLLVFRHAGQPARAAALLPVCHEAVDRNEGRMTSRRQLFPCFLFRIRNP